MRAALTTAIEVLGFGVVSAGFWRLSVASGLIAAGCSLILIGYLAAAPKAGKK